MMKLKKTKHEKPIKLRKKTVDGLKVRKPKKARKKMHRMEEAHIEEELINLGY